MATSTNEDPIKHVVLLMFENSSFDRYLGCFKKLYPDLEGILPGGSPRTNTDAEGKIFEQKPTDAVQMPGDPKHESVFVAEQLVGGNGGFVRDYSMNYPSSPSLERQLIMSYYDMDKLPALHSLARDFLICDHWFASLPGPTWPNRFFALSGTSNGLVVMPTNLFTARMVFEENQPTIFSRLLEAGRSWKTYFHDLPASLILHTQQNKEALKRYYDFSQFEKDCAQPETFPDFVFIEPKYYGVDQSDDHPPHNVMKAQKLMADVYNAIRKNEELWKSTLLVITYDEHGGFYDHVVPPPAVPPRYPLPNDEYAFNQYGVRVPTLLVSPWVQRGFDGTVFDHTSLLKYLVDKWKLGPLGDRVAAANSVAPLIKDSQPMRVDTIGPIDTSAIPLNTGDPQLEAKPSGHHLGGDIALAIIQDEAGIEIIEDISEFSRTGKISEKWLWRRLIAMAIRIACRILVYSKLSTEEQKALDRQKKINSVKSMMDRARRE